MKEERIIVSNETTNSVSINSKRRNLNKAIWATPLIGSVALPSHAQTTPTTNSPPTTNPPVEPESICGVDRCPTINDFMLRATIHQYYEGDTPGGRLVPNGAVGWNSAVEVIGCDDADLTFVWTNRNNTSNTGTFNPVTPSMIDQSNRRILDEELWVNGADVPNRTDFRLIEFRVLIESPGCDSILLGVNFAIVPGNKIASVFSDYFEITRTGVGGTTLVDSSTVTLTPT